MIETQFGRIADALERLVVLMEHPATTVEPTRLVDPAKTTKKEVELKGVEVPTPKEVEPEPKPQPTEITLDALRKSLAPLDPTAGRALLEQFGVKKVSELQPEQYLDVLKAAKAAK